MPRIIVETNTIEEIPEESEVPNEERTSDDDQVEAPETPPRRRTRRISGVQPDPTLTPAQLKVTPAKRAKVSVLKNSSNSRMLLLTQ